MRNSRRSAPNPLAHCMMAFLIEEVGPGVPAAHTLNTHAFASACSGSAALGGHHAVSRWHRLLFACSLQLERRWRGAGGCHGPSSALATAYIGRRATEPRATASPGAPSEGPRGSRPRAVAGFCGGPIRDRESVHVKTRGKSDYFDTFWNLLSLPLLAHNRTSICPPTRHLVPHLWAYRSSVMCQPLRN